MSTDADLQRECERVLNLPEVGPPTDPTAYDLIPILIRLGVTDMAFVDICELAEGAPVNKRWIMMGTDIRNGQARSWQFC